MKKFTKIMSMVLLIAMCMSMFTIGAFAEEHVCGTEKAYYEGTAATCEADGMEGHWQCSCGKWYKDEACTQYVGNADELKIASPGHALVAVAAKDATCAAEGNVAYSYCSVCNTCFAPDGVTVLTNGKSDALLAKVPHSLGTKTEAIAPTCTEAGSIEYYLCGFGCGTKLDASGNVVTSITVAALDHDYNENDICTRCGDKLNAPAPFAVTGNVSVDYTNASSFKYQVTDPATYVLASISADGYNLVRGAGFSYDSYTGAVTIDKAALSAIVSGKSSIELVFTATDGSVVRGFIITNSENIVVEDLYISGLTQNKYVKESGKAVSFQTNLTDPSCVKIFSGSTQLDIPTTGFTFTAAYGDVYTYSFDNTFLDNLDCGYYQIRCYYGNTNSEYVTPGTLMISDPNTNVDDVLYFVNSTQGDNEYYKYVSGDEVPRMYCELFLIDGARLQVSTNGGKSWSNVNVHNYYIEPNKSGKDTSHAWIGSAYLDSLNADTIYYFRVVVPASSNGTNADWTSNTVSVTTGPTLKAVDTAKHVINSTKNLKFVASEKIAKVYVGNVQLTDENDFNISNDGKTVTLSPSFLNKRTAGSTYTIKVLTQNGEYASTTFQILTTAQASASPRTGDTSNIALWTAVLMLSAGAAVAVLPRLKKEQ